MASSGDLRSLLGPAIFSQIPQNAQVSFFVDEINETFSLHMIEC